MNSGLELKAPDSLKDFRLLTFRLAVTPDIRRIGTDAHSGATAADSNRVPFWISHNVTWDLQLNYCLFKERINSITRFYRGQRNLSKKYRFYSSVGGEESSELVSTG
jgi:hypothetical protein